MKREDERKYKKKQKKAFIEFLKAENKYFGNFKGKLNRITDPRHESYINYKLIEILYPLILKNAMNIESMRTMTESFNQEEIIENMKYILKKEKIEEIPHYITINECMKDIRPEELEKIRYEMINKLIRRKIFYQDRFLGKYWRIVIDGTSLFHFKERHCKHCLKKTRIDKETGEEKTYYYHNVLEAKIVFNQELSLSIATEFIENENENVSKQDCEINAAKRLLKKIKKAFPRLPICILGDSLYAAKSIFDICEENKWKYIMYLKAGRIPSIVKEYEILEKEKHIKKGKESYWVNDIDYREKPVNVIKHIETKKENKVEFLWVSNIKIKTKKQATELVETARMRWLIENQGFNVQKNLRYHIHHLNSLNYQAIKNHYLIIQITDIIIQMYEKGDKLIKALKKTIKNISSDLYKSFSQSMTREDILVVRELYKNKATT